MGGVVKAKITAADVENVLPLKSWWAICFVLPLVRPLTAMLVNRTSITPNAVTVTSILFRIVTAIAFLMQTQEGYVIGAIAYYIAYLLDCMDGAVARLRKMSSEFGRFLDHIGDLGGDIMILSALAFGQGVLMTPMVIGMLYMHLADCYIHFLSGNICRTATACSSSVSLVNFFNNYRDWWFNRNIKSFFSFPDYAALIFVFFPLCNRVEEGLQVGFFVLLSVCLYAILSTFVSILTGRNHFP